MNTKIDELITNIEKLDDKTIPQWGTMTAQKMVEHLINTFRISSGKLEIECFTEERKLPILKRFLFSDKPVEDYYDYFEENPDSIFINPTFGPLNKEEWERFHIKHLTHHLTQFGLRT
jgi:hypothetical protein